MLFDFERQVIHFFFQELAHGLNELLSYEGNVEEDFYSTFQVLERADSCLPTVSFIHEQCHLLLSTLC